MVMGFEKLKVWQKAKKLAVEIYDFSNKGKLFRDYSLRDQLRRSAVSVSSNIAEGDERDTDKDAIRFFYIAKGSLAELRTQLIILFEIGYIDKIVFEKFMKESEELAKMLGALIKARKK